MKKIISTALMVIMLLTSVIMAIPLNAFAAESSASEPQDVESKLTFEETQAYINNFYLKSNYSTAEEMLEALSNVKYKDFVIDQDMINQAVNAGKDINEKLNPLVSAASADGMYTIHVDRYSGFVFYVNNVTGQILTSNPVDVSACTADVAQTVMSQISVAYTEIANSRVNETLNSTKWAALYSQISVSEISGGLRVNYTIGDTSTRFLLPGMISARNFHDHIFTPIITTYKALYSEAMAAAGIDAATAAELLNSKYFELRGEEYTEGKEINYYYAYTYSADLAGTVSEYVVDPAKLGSFINAVRDASASSVSSEYKTKIETIRSVIEPLMVLQTNGYVLKDSNSDFYYNNGELIGELLANDIKKYPVMENMPVYIFHEDTFAMPLFANFRQYSGYIKQYCPEYTFDMMYAHEAECGFKYDSAQKPVFECALEYTFNSDGSLAVALPSNSIIFDETVYIVSAITPNQYFGCGDMSKEGYLFYPDGSGSILDFGDFYNKEAVNYISKTYGKDYCYSYQDLIEKHREHIVVPVYGIVSTVAANRATSDAFGLGEVKNGCLVILEEGNSLASLGFASSPYHKYLSAFASYAPYPVDKFELSATISVSTTADMNTMVGEIKYAGSYVSRIVMLTDDAIGERLYGAGNYYPTSYTGMAAYYRNILKANGTLTALENTEESIPLYIETLGAMTILDKFLTFPVEKSIPLTTFEDVATIYSQLSDAENYVKLLIDRYTEYADEAYEEGNDLLEIEYRAKAKKYTELKDKVKNIKNVNFKLTGYANGGMNFTYPTKLKWEKCCGGASGFEDLLAFSAEQSEKSGYSLGIFPDFDFLYINNTARFDGISNKGNVSKMVDNRYASKQVYNSVLADYESFFAMVISTDTLKEHFESFNEKYSEFGHSKLSISTLGSDLNSNFNEKNTIDRENSKKNTVAFLEEVVYQNEYEVMMDTGNIYAAKFATHILNAPVDFSSSKYSSYAVPFVGMLLHGYVNYAGSPLNYSGSPDYDILRAIEGGANPYYIVCFQNTAYMKDDEKLNKYYGIDYENWYDEILVSYDRLNTAIGGLQNFEIVDHTTVLAERTPDKAERVSNYNTLKEELLAIFRSQLSAAADEYVSNYGSKVKVVVDVDALYSQFAGKILAKYDAEVKEDLTDDGKSALKEAIREVAVEYANKYSGNATPVTLNFSEIVNADGVAYTSYREYSSYSFTTDSKVTENKTYDRTVYTVDTDNVVMVTYRKGNEEVKFILNYNLFAVDVKLPGSNETHTIESYDYLAIGLNK